MVTQLWKSQGHLMRPSKTSAMSWGVLPFSQKEQSVQLLLDCFELRPQTSRAFRALGSNKPNPEMAGDSLRGDRWDRLSIQEPTQTQALPATSPESQVRGLLPPPSPSKLGCHYSSLVHSRKTDCDLQGPQKEPQKQRAWRKHS